MNITQLARCRHSTVVYVFLLYLLSSNMSLYSALFSPLMYFRMKCFYFYEQLKEAKAFNFKCRSMLDSAHIFA